MNPFKNSDNQKQHQNNSTSNRKSKRSRKRGRNREKDKQPQEPVQHSPSTTSLNSTTEEKKQSEMPKQVYSTVNLPKSGQPGYSPNVHVKQSTKVQANIKNADSVDFQLPRNLGKDRTQFEYHQTAVHDNLGYFTLDPDLVTRVRHDIIRPSIEAKPQYKRLIEHAYDKLFHFLCAFQCFSTTDDLKSHFHHLEQIFAQLSKTKKVPIVLRDIAQMVGTINTTHGEVTQNLAYTQGLSFLLKGCLLEADLLAQHGVPSDLIDMFKVLNNSLSSVEQLVPMTQAQLEIRKQTVTSGVARHNQVIQNLESVKLQLELDQLSPENQRPPNIAEKIQLVEQRIAAERTAITTLNNSLTNVMQQKRVPPRYFLHSTTPLFDLQKLGLDTYMHGREQFPVPMPEQIGDGEGQVPRNRIFMLQQQVAAYNAINADTNDDALLRALAQNFADKLLFLPDGFQTIHQIRHYAQTALDVILDIIGSYAQKTSFVNGTFEPTTTGSLCQLWEFKDGLAVAPTFLNKSSMAVGLGFQFSINGSVQLAPTFATFRDQRLDVVKDVMMRDLKNLDDHDS